MIKSLTSLRGIFILFIFFHHCLNLYTGGGTMAVSFFFVLGGFGLTLGYKNRVIASEFSYKQYLSKRIIKFYPLHWICLLASLPFALLSFSFIQIPVFAINASLLQSWIPIKEVYFSYNAVSWYLANTLFFAVVFPLLLKWIVNASTKGKTLIAMGFVVVYAVVAMLIPKEMHHAILYISPYIRLTDFVLGVFLALGFLKLKERPIVFLKNSILSQSLVFVLIALLVLESCVLSEDVVLFAPVYWPFVAMLILTTSVSEVIWGGQKLLSNKYLLRLGELSFTIFLIHQLILRYSSVFFGKILHIENILVYVIFTFVLTILVSAVVEKYILKPITQWLTKRIQPSMTAHS